MAIWNHWHPVLLSRELKGSPVAVRLAGRDFVVFRTRQGQIGAFDDICPHRRMKLSLGSVDGDKLRCLYHGWTFDCDGNGESPATPKLYACASVMEAVERHGAIWLRGRGASTEFPNLDIDGHFNVCNLTHTINAPLELVVDNFCEIEHTPTTHDFFGYPLNRMHEVQVEFQPTDTSVRVINHGPRKKMFAPYRWLLGIGKHYQFMDDWTTYFSPVYSCYNHWWQHPESGRKSMVRWRLYIFFVPIDAGTTRLITLAYTKSDYPGPAGGVRLLAWLLNRKLDHEIRLDVRILEGLADKSVAIDGMKLSRFDRVLGLNRERIARIYRGVGV